MRLRTFTLCLVLTACISEDRRHTSDLETDPQDTAIADTVDDTDAPDLDQPDTALPDTADTVDATDTVDTADTTDTTDSTPLDTADILVTTEVLDGDTVTGPECLSTGCTTASADCPVRPGWCFIAGVCYAEGSADPANTCRVCNPNTPTTFSAATLGIDCDDGIACTSKDACLDGQCVGTSNCAASTLVCATSGCNKSTGHCELTVDSGNCVVGNACYVRGQSDTSSLCQHCEPGVDQFAMVSGDRDEPTNGFDQSVNLGSFGDAETDIWSEPPRYASLSPATDRDFYRFDYNTAVSFHRPGAKVTPDIEAPGLTLEVCVFASCPVDPNAGATDLSILCFDGATKVVEGGKVGCCKTAAASRVAPLEVTPDRAFCSRNGSAIQSRADAFVTVKRIVPPAQPSCFSYAIQRGVRLVR